MNNKGTDKTILQGEIEQEIKKEILFLSDHWTTDDKMPFKFGGWLDEVVDNIATICLSKVRKAEMELAQEILNISSELPERFIGGESGKLSAINNKLLAKLSTSKEEK